MTPTTKEDELEAAVGLKETGEVGKALLGRKLTWVEEGNDIGV